MWNAHWRHLAKTIELSMCGGNAACCQITLATCCGLASTFDLVLFAFVVLGLVSSVLRQEIGWEERLQNDLCYIE